MLVSAPLALAAALAVLPGAPVVTDDGDAPERVQAGDELLLDNGIRITLFEAPLAPQQSLFTFLPMGLLSDGPGQTQATHLIEHLMIRSTDPVELQVDGMLMNGETTALAMRLESFAPPERWTETLDRHLAWLEAREVAADVLEREQAAIAQELEFTVGRGFTHKWALAAWNQAVRHGAEDVAVRGDVAGATPDRAEAMLVSRLAAGPGLHVVSVGPVPLEEARAALQAAYGGFEGAPLPLMPPALTPDAIRAVGDREASWDLPRRHHMEWYPVPADTPLERVQADALAQLVNVRLSQRGRLRSVGVEVTAQADLVTPEGRWFLISASLPDGVDPGLVRSELDDILEALSPTADVNLIIRQLAVQLLELPDFGEVREQMGEHPAAEWIEAQQMLYILYAQLNMGLDASTLAETYPDLDAEGLVEFGRGVLDPEKRSTLLLTPGG